MGACQGTDGVLQVRVCTVSLVPAQLLMPCMLRVPLRDYCHGQQLVAPPLFMSVCVRLLVPALRG